MAGKRCHGTRAFVFFVQSLLKRSIRLNPQRIELDRVWEIHCIF